MRSAAEPRNADRTISSPDGAPPDATSPEESPSRGGLRERLFWSARARILLSYIALLALSMIVSILFIRQILLVRLDEQVGEQFTQEVQEFRRLAGGIDPRTSQPFGSDVRAIFDVYFSRNVPNEGEALLSIVDGEPYRVRRSSDAPLDLVNVEDSISRWAELRTTERGEMETPAGTMLYLAVPVRGEGGRVLGTFVVMNFPAFERGEIDSAIRTVIVVSVAVFFLATLVAWGFTGSVLSPLRLLNLTARSISDTDLTRRIPISGNDEVSQVAQTFNGMLDRLEGAFNAQRQFLDDAGHELRTPITIVRGHLELLGDEDPAERQQTLDLVLDELDRMGRMVNDLLLLAKAQQPDFLELDRVDVRALTTEVHAKAMALAPRRWQMEEPSPGSIVADRQRLTQSLMQLAQNAVEHTGEDDWVTLGAALSNGRARFWVRDSGPGIPPGDEQLIFERFGRAEGGRRAEGAGLGLSIVKAISEAHGGTVEVSSRPGAGATFTITIPAEQNGEAGGAP